ncbi:MAG: hypothetical protein KA956_04630 [Pyrinomonadaceae bacterium]|nr:hypothetical protein [Acidobacteriota bacterium]MBP7375739.1 hypothetical protein [Pyrinomonadaceae bacterium]
MVNIDDICAFLDGHHEWLLVREFDKTFPLDRTEIEVGVDGDKTMFGFLDDNGFHSWRLNDATLSNNEISLDVAGAFGRKRETIRLVPRVAAAEIAAEIEIARLKMANEIAAMIEPSFPGTKLGRVALNVETGRLAQIQFETIDKIPMAAIADITGKLTSEAVMTAAMLWLEKLGSRKKKPVLDIWIICEKRSSRNTQKLHTLLTEKWKAKITVLEIDRKLDPPRLIELPKRKIRDLWREKARKLVIPADPMPSETARKIIDLAPEKIDIIYSKQGETLRFMGLPFGRVRSIMGEEKAWFGVGTNRSILGHDNADRLRNLVAELTLNRSPDPPNKRHEFFRTAPEAWLESILRRNIKLLDGNVILSPIYNQFRSSNDKIDLLALRCDGRLVIIELKTQPDREMVFQAADYWRKIELQRRRGLLAEANLFGGMEIMDKPALVYLTAPAWSFHRDFEFFAKAVSPEIELWRFELHEHWREAIRVVGRMGTSE